MDGYAADAEENGKWNPTGRQPSPEVFMGIRENSTNNLTVLFLESQQQSESKRSPERIPLETWESNRIGVSHVELPSEDLTANMRLAQAQFDHHRPNLVVATSGAGAVAMNIDIREVPLFLIRPAWSESVVTKPLNPGTVVACSSCDYEQLRTFTLSQLPKCVLDVDSWLVHVREPTGWQSMFESVLWALQEQPIFLSEWLCRYFEPYFKMIYGWVLQTCNSDEPDPENIAAEAYLRMLVNQQNECKIFGWPYSSRPKRPQAWKSIMWRAVKSENIDCIRSEAVQRKHLGRKTRVGEQDLTKLVSREDYDANRAEWRHKFTRAVGLTADHADLVLERYFDEKKGTDVAARRGLSEGRLSQLLADARKQILSHFISAAELSSVQRDIFHQYYTAKRPVEEIATETASSVADVEYCLSSLLSRVINNCYWLLDKDN